MKHKCDFCGATFEEEEVAKIPINPEPGIEIIGMSIFVWNSKTEKLSRTSTHSLQEGDCTLHCPECKKVHLFGFDLAT